MDSDLLVSLARLRDKHGVLSIYVTADPATAPGPHPAWQLRLRGELATLRERVRAEGPRERWLALDQRLAELAPELSTLLDPAGHGVGRALFAPLGQDVAWSLALQLPLPDRVELDHTACLLPLMAAFEEGAPAGVAVVSRDRVRLFDWELGKAEVIETVSFRPPTEDWREMKGKPPANPAMSQKAVSQRDLFERRVDGLLAKFLRDSAHAVPDHASERGWDVLVVAGDPRLADAFDAGVRERASSLVTLHVPQVLSSASTEQIAAAVTPELRAARAGRRAALVERARSAALAGGLGAYGLADTLTALDEGRVARLLLNGTIDWCGSRAPDGRLVAQDQVPLGVEPDALVPESHLAERMVERALATGAAVTVVDGAAADTLAPAGVAALLRW